MLLRDANLSHYSFLVGIHIPGGRVANLVSFLKHLNLVKANFLRITHDTLGAMMPDFLESVQDMIRRDNEHAYSALKDLGVTSVSHPPQYPDLSGCPQHYLEETNPAFTIHGNDHHSRTYLDIGSAQRDILSEGSSKRLVSGICRLLCCCMQEANIESIWDAVVPTDGAWGLSRADTKHLKHYLVNLRSKTLREWGMERPPACFEWEDLGEDC